MEGHYAGGIPHPQYRRLQQGQGRGSHQPREVPQASSAAGQTIQQLLALLGSILPQSWQQQEQRQRQEGAGGRSTRSKLAYVLLASGKRDAELATILGQIRDNLLPWTPGMCMSCDGLGLAGGE